MNPELVTVVVSVLSIVFAYILVVVVRAVERDANVNRLLKQYGALFNTITREVIRVAVVGDAEDWEDYEEEAEETGRDIRMVVVMHRIQPELERLGLDLDVEEIVSMIEEAYQKYINAE